MYKYVLKRLLLLIPVLLGVAFIVFSITALTPGDPGRLILGQQATQEMVDQLNHELGYDLPFFTRFFNYIKDIVLKGDFGVSYRTQEPVFNEIMLRFPYTLKLATSSMILASLLGITLGIISAVKQYSLLDKSLTVCALSFAVIPGFWLGMMLIYVFAIRLHVLPSGGADSIKAYILPVITVALGAAGGLLRLTRSTMLEAIRENYICTAKAKGASQRTIIWKHALRNALMPVITSISMTFGQMLGSTVVTEAVFTIPGLGSHIVTAIQTKDVPVVLASTLFLATVFCLLMLILDVIYAYIDPRIKAKYLKQ